MHIWLHFHLLIIYLPFQDDPSKAEITDQVETTIKYLMLLTMEQLAAVEGDFDGKYEFEFAVDSNFTLLVCCSKLECITILKISPSITSLSSEKEYDLVGMAKMALRSLRSTPNNIPLHYSRKSVSVSLS